MGAVYRARHRENGAVHAVKVILASRLGGEGQDNALARFHREVEVLARIAAHPHIVRVHSSGVDRGIPWCAMDCVEGKPLSEELDQGPLRPRRAATVLALLGRAIAHAHVHGVVHRDLKPENVLIDASGAPHVVDFGLAFDAFAEQLTRTGELLGTPSFMAPEQVSRGGHAETTRAIDERTDVYGLGAIFYATLTGRPPFGGKPAFSLLADIIRNPPPRPRTLVADLPPELEAICLRCLEKDPLDRYPDAAAFADDLERFLRGEAIDTASTSRRWSSVLPAFMRPRTRVGRFVSYGLGATTLLGITAVVIFLRMGGVFGPTPKARTDALARTLERDGRLDAEGTTALAALAADADVTTDPALAKRVETLAALAALLEATADPGDDAARGVARLVRDGDEIRERDLRHAVSALRVAGRLRAAAIILHEVEPAVAVSDPGLATELATAMAAEARPGDSLPPPPPRSATSLRALLRAPRIDDAARGRIVSRRAMRILAEDGEAGHADALAGLEEAFDDYAAVVPATEWTPALHRYAVESLLTRAVEGDPNAWRLSDLLVAAELRREELPADLVARAQSAAGVDTLLSDGMAVGGVRSSDLMLVVGPILAMSGRWPVHPTKLKVLTDEPMERLFALAEEDGQRPPRRRNPARVVWIVQAILSKATTEATWDEEMRVRISSILDAAAASGTRNPCILTLLADSFDDIRERDKAAPLFERSLEQDRRSSASTRIPAIPEKVARFLMGAEVGVDVDRAARLTTEAMRILEASLETRKQLTEAGAMAPYWLAREDSLPTLMTHIIKMLVARPPPHCCGPDGVVFDELAAAALKLFQHPSAKIVLAFQAETTGPLDAAVHSHRAFHHLRHGRPADALADLDRAVELENLAHAPDGRRRDQHLRLAEYESYRATVLARLGRADDARAAQQKMLEHQRAAGGR